MDLAAVACSFVYFEKLIINNTVKKTNRKLIAGSLNTDLAICLLLACKVNDGKDADSIRLIEVLKH